MPLPFKGMTFQTTIKKNNYAFVFNNCKTYEVSTDLVNSQISSTSKQNPKEPDTSRLGDAETVSWGSSSNGTHPMEVLTGEKPKTSQSHGPDVGPFKHDDDGDG